jgi:hypothetical protein
MSNLRDAAVPCGSERFREEYRIVNVNACGEAFCRGEIGGYDDVPDFLTSESTDVKLCNVNRTLGVVAPTGTFMPLI